jgi:hypothetical protein
MVLQTPGHGEWARRRPLGIELPMRIKESSLRTGHGPESETRTARRNSGGSQAEETERKDGRDDWIRTSDPLLPKRFKYLCFIRNSALFGGQEVTEKAC